VSEVERFLGRESGAVGAVRVALRAGWWTLLIGVLFLLYAWLAGLLLLKIGIPGWMLAMWGGASVTDFRLVWLLAVGFFKFSLGLILLALIWGTLCLRALKKETSGR
jgi:hypothetical protein